MTVLLTELKLDEKDAELLTIDAAKDDDAAVRLLLTAVIEDAADAEFAATVSRICWKLAVSEPDTTLMEFWNVANDWLVVKAKFCTESTAASFEAVYAFRLAKTAVTRLARELEVELEVETTPSIRVAAEEDATKSEATDPANEEETELRLELTVVIDAAEEDEFALTVVVKAEVSDAAVVTRLAKEAEIV